MFKNNTSLQKIYITGSRFDCYFVDNRTREISATYELIIFPNGVNGGSELKH